MTRRLNKKLPKFFTKLPQKSAKIILNIKVSLFKIALKDTEIFGLLLKENVLPRV